MTQKPPSNLNKFETHRVHLTTLHNILLIGQQDASLLAFSWPVGHIYGETLLGALVLLPHSKKTPNSNPLSVQSLHVLPIFAWVLWLLPPSPTVQRRAFKRLRFLKRKMDGRMPWQFVK